MSIRQAAAETGVHKTTIEQNLKRDRINKTAIKKLVEEKTIIEAKLKAMPPAVAEKVNAEVDKNLEAMEFYKNSARVVAKIAVMSLETNPEPTASDAKTTMETLKTGMVVEGVVPYYPNAATINNTNAQQNNTGDNPENNRPVINFIGV